MRVALVAEAKLTVRLLVVASHSASVAPADLAAFSMFDLHMPQLPFTEMDSFLVSWAFTKQVLNVAMAIKANNLSDFILYV
jgi:hypothetical protein